MIGGILPGFPNTPTPLPQMPAPQSANQAAQMQMVYRDMWMREAAMDPKGLNADEFADLMVKSQSGFGPAKPGGNQAESIYNQLLSDSAGFKKLSKKYRSGNHKPKPGKADKKEFNRSKKLFKQLKEGKLTPQELMQKLKEPQAKKMREAFDKQERADKQ